MWQLIPWRRQILIITAIAVVLAWGLDAIFELFKHEPAPLLKFISLIAAVITFIIVGIASFVWRNVWKRFPIIARKTFPDFSGIWEGQLVSTWIDPVTGNPVPPISATLWIRQSLFSISIKLRTGESTSHSTRCILEADREAGRFRAWYSYDNQPRAEVAHRSAKHEGVGWLEMDFDEDPDKLAGQYYTSRRTTGDMSFVRINRESARDGRGRGAK